MLEALPVIVVQSTLAIHSWKLPTGGFSDDVSNLTAILSIVASFCNNTSKST